MYQIDTHFISYEVEYNQSYVVKDGIQLKSVNLEPGYHMFYHKGYILLQGALYFSIIHNMS